MLNVRLGIPLVDIPVGGLRCVCKALVTRDNCNVHLSTCGPLISAARIDRHNLITIAIQQMVEELGLYARRESGHW